MKSADIVIQQMDLASLDSVKECAKRIIETESKIDVLINNAGTVCTLVLEVIYMAVIVFESFREKVFDSVF